MKDIFSNKPSLARIILSFMSRYNNDHLMLDNLNEEFKDIAKSENIRKAKLWYWKQALHSFLPYCKISFIWSLIMYKNYLKIALRNIKRHKGYSFINIFGLAFGLAISFVLTFYVLDDLNYDRFHDGKDEIHRILSVSARGTRNSITAGPLVLKVKEDIPEIIASTRVTRNRINVKLIDAGNEDSGVDGMALVTDPGFFDVFSFEIIAGRSADALLESGSVFLTEEFAKKIFGEENPVGQLLNIERIENAYVAGIIKTPPGKSHIQFEAVIPLIAEARPDLWDSWENLGVIGYVRLIENADVESTVEKMVQVGKDNKLYELFEPRLQPLMDIHLGSADNYYDYYNIGKNDIVVVIALGTIGIIVLLIACINFVNLSTARVAKRAREVGIRKVVGSNKRQLSSQFIGESILFTVISFVIAMVIIQVMSPYLNNILGKDLNLDLIDNIAILSIMFVLSLLLGIFSGIYPALVLSSFNAVKVLKGEYQSGSTGVMMRRILIVFQFALTISLMVGVLIVYDQIDYLKTINLGYNRDNVVAIRGLFRNDEDIAKNRLSDFPGIISMGRINATPGGGFTRLQIIPEGTDRKSSYTASDIRVDEDLFETLEISFSAGRSFSREIAGDSRNAVIVNETLANKAEWKEPIGRQLDIVTEVGVTEPHTVIGVIKNFHYLPTRTAPEPMIFRFNPERGFVFLARISQDQTSSMIAKTEEIFKEVHPDREFSYFFLDDQFNEQFEDDKSFAANIGIFSVIAVFIACLGLIGLASHTIEQRRKEMVVRKILGCKNNRIIYLLSSDFLKWVLISNLFAWPAAFFAMSKWIEGFVYKMPFEITPFLVAGAGSVIIAFITIFYQTAKLAKSNPVDSLRYE